MFTARKEDGYLRVESSESMFVKTPVVRFVAQPDAEMQKLKEKLLHAPE